MFRWYNRLKNKKGFTLIELIVVLAVLGIIALIAIPRFLSVQAQAKIDADYGTAAGMAKAAELYYVQTPSIQKVTGTQTITPGVLSGSGYLDAWTSWQSQTGTPDITISCDDGTVVVKASSSGATLYPKP